VRYLAVIAVGALVACEAESMEHTSAAVSADAGIEGDGGPADGGPADGGTADDCKITRSATVASGDLPCPVAAVISARCQPCHQSPPKNGAHFPILSYEDTQQKFGIDGLLRFQRMGEVIAPGGLPHMPPVDHPQLASDELDTLLGWLSACAPPVPEGSGCDTNHQ
jgi:hypothetical protein